MAAPIEFESPLLSSISMESHRIKPSNTENVTSGSLFPAYNEDENVSISPEHKAEATASFPAYKSANQVLIDTNLDWLTLNSFPEANVDDLLTLQNRASKKTALGSSENEEVAAEIVKEKKHRKKLKRVKTERQQSDASKIADPPVLQKKEHGLYDEINQKTFIEDTGLALERAYRVDKKPDYENLGFDTFYAKDIARYRVSLLLPLGVKSNDPLYVLYMVKQELKKKRKKGDRYFSSSNIKALRGVASEPVSLKDACDTQPREYIPLDSAIAETKNVEEKKPEINALGIYDSATEHYLSGISIKNVRDPLRECIHPVTSSTEPEQNAWQKLTNRRTEEFNKRLRENPKDIQLWLEFVAFQDELMPSDLYGRDKLDGKRYEVGCLDRKVAILDRALKTNPQSVDLAVLKLQTCQFLWERDKLFSEWKKLIFIHPSQPKVWHHYLRFLQSSFSTFSVQIVIKGFMKAISTLVKVEQGTLNVHSRPLDLEEKILDLIYEFVQFLLSSGYSERAMATYQALVEFNFFQPNLPADSPLSDWIAFFEPFWDSGVSRIGETGAKGWGEVVTHKLLTPTSSVGFTDLNDKEDGLIKSDHRDFEIWHQFEVLRENNHWLPWRPNFDHPDEEEACEDSERMVSVDDITPVIFPIQSDTNRFRLILHFLCILGISVPCQQFSILNHLNLLCIPSQLQFKSKPQPAQNLLKLPTTLHLELLTNFIASFLSQIRSVLSPSQRLELDVITVQHRVHEVLCNQAAVTAKQFIVDIKSVKKVVKGVLSEEANRNDLELWLEYLRLELHSSKASDTQKVFDMIFASQQRNPNIWRFTWAYVKAVLNAKTVISHKELLYLFVCLTSGEKYNPNKKDVPPVVVLRARAGFEAAVNGLKNFEESNDFVFIKRPSNYICCCICYTFFLHLTSGPTVAQDWFHKLLEDPNLRGIDREEAHLGVLHLRLFSDSPLRCLRPALNAALADFPSNIAFLGLLLDTGGGSYLASHTRRLFSHLLSGSRDPCPVEWLFAILAELRLLHAVQSMKAQGEGEFPEVGITWRVRSLFEKALKKPNLMHSGPTWRIFMQFEMKYGHQDRAKSIFYRSLQSCPGYKLLYLDACKFFPEDLKLIVELLSEKEVRLRTPLEEVHMLMVHAGHGDNITVLEENQPEMTSGL